MLVRPREHLTILFCVWCEIARGQLNTMIFISVQAMRGLIEATVLRKGKTNAKTQERFTYVKVPY